MIGIIVLKEITVNIFRVVMDAVNININAIFSKCYNSVNYRNIFGERKYAKFCRHS